MLKRCTLLLLVCSLLAGWAFPACAGGLSKADRYHAALNELKMLFNGDNNLTAEELFSVFSGLGTYQKSTAFGCYTAILRDVELENYASITLYANLMRMDEDFCALLEVENLPSVDELEAYALGRQAELAGDPAAAIGYYGQSIAVLDSMTRLMALNMNAPAVQPTAPTAASSAAAPPKSTSATAPTPTPRPAPVLVTQTNVVADRYRITTYSDNTCQITRYTGTGNTIIIPEYLNGYRVTSIGESAFAKNKKITSVTIPDGVTAIGKKAFYFCSELKRVTLPDSITIIGDHAFYYCDFTSIKLPARLQIIESNAFGSCYQLINVTIPEGVTTIGGWAFSSCRELVQVAIPSSVTAIGNDAFFQCRSLKLVVPANSYAYRYAVEYSIPCTTY